MPFIAQAQVIPIPDSIGVVTDDFDLSTITTADVIFAVAAMIGGIFLSQIAKRAIRRLLNDIEGMPDGAGDMTARIVGYVILTLGTVLALEALGFSFGLLGSLILLIIVMLVLATKPLLLDLGAGLIILFRRPFVPGDRISIGDVDGVVDDISARTVRLRTPDARRVHYPNRTVLDGAITNMSAEGKRMATFVVGAAYDTDLETACQVIDSALASTESVLAEPAPRAYVEEFADSTINIACRFWHEPFILNEWESRDEAMRAVKRALDANGITIAFPQRVVWSGAEAA